MAAPMTQWAVTAIAHPALRGVREDCPDCLALADLAITMARVTGSTGGTDTDSRSGSLISPHSVTVARAITVIERA